VNHPKNPMKNASIERKNNLVWLEKLRHDTFDDDDDVRKNSVGLV